MSSFDENLFSGMIAISVITGVGLIVFAFIKFTLFSFLILGCLVFILGLGALVNWIDWENVFDEIAIFFRKIKNIKIEWRD